MKRPGTLALLALLVLLAAVPFRRVPQTNTQHPHHPSSSSSPVHPSAQNPRDAWRRSIPVARAGRTDPQDAPGSPLRPDWLDRLIRGETIPVSAETLDRWFASGHTNAADLMAAHQAGGGHEFLEKALQEFPNDPRVLLGAAAMKASPEVRRERLDRLRSADPHNALAEYLAAWNEFKAGDPEKALEHLAAATAKPGFNDYVLESMKAAEALFLFEGRSPTEAIADGSSSALLPHLPQLKEVSKYLTELQSQAIATEDLAAAKYYARIGMRLSERLSKDPGSTILIGELVGWAIEKNSLQAFPPESSVDFLKGTIGERLAQIEERKAASKAEFDVFQRRFAAASETEVQAFYEHMHAHGERTAIRWFLEEKNPSLTP